MKRCGVVDIAEKMRSGDELVRETIERKKWTRDGGRKHMQRHLPVGFINASDLTVPRLRDALSRSAFCEENKDRYNVDVKKINPKIFEMSGCKLLKLTVDIVLCKLVELLSCTPSPN
jgi:hypothetical protein